MRPLLALSLSLMVTLGAFADPTPAQLAVVKAYDGQVFSANGLKKVETSNGWTQYQWTQGRSIYVNTKSGVVAVVEKDGTEIYRYSETEYLYRFPDGRTITSNPKTGAKTWNVTIGDPAPDFDLPTLDGKSRIKLSSLKGQVVFLDFWASWCGPCQQYLPDTEALHQKFKAKGLRVIGVNIEGDAAKAAQNAASLKLTFPSVVAQTTAEGANWATVQIRDYGIDSIPRAILIDKKGIIRASDTVLDVPELLAKLLAE